MGFKNEKSKKIISVVLMVMVLNVGAFSFGSSAQAVSNSTVQLGAIPTAISTSSTQVLADGGQIYSYNIDNMTITCPVPPSGFSPLTATYAQLAEYAFPPRPKNNPSELALWNQEMSYYKATVKPNISAYTKKAGTASAMNYPGVDNSWAGYGDYYKSYSQPVNNWCAVQGDFVQPTNSSGTSGNSECSWVGLGGSLTGALSQAGTIMNNPDAYDGFYECMDAIGDDLYVNTSLKVSKSDKMHIYISYQSSNNLFNYYIADNSTGLASQNTITPKNNLGPFYAYDGSTAEWIDEMPSITDNLSNFGKISWANCQA
jgi:hypothetical protein